MSRSQQCHNDVTHINQNSDIPIWTYYELYIGYSEVYLLCTVILTTGQKEKR